MASAKPTIAKKVVGCETRAIIAKVYEFMQEDAKGIIEIVSDPFWTSQPGYIVLLTEIKDHMNKICERTAQATGVSKATVSHIKKEKETSSTFKSPHKYRKPRDPKFKLDSFNTDFIRETVENYLSEYKEKPTLLKLRNLFKEKINFEGHSETLRRILIKLELHHYLSRNRSK